MKSVSLWDKGSTCTVPLKDMLEAGTAVVDSNLVVTFQIGSNGAEPHPTKNPVFPTVGTRHLQYPLAVAGGETLPAQEREVEAGEGMAPCLPLLEPSPSAISVTPMDHCVLVAHADEQMAHLAQQPPIGVNWGRARASASTDVRGQFYEAHENRSAAVHEVNTYKAYTRQPPHPVPLVPISLL